jgi:C-terminal processing protease CtpA/Prc
VIIFRTMRSLSSRILSVLVSALIFGVAAHAQAEASYQRLADAAKLWVYVKYFHPRVTAAPLEWDRAFAESAPKVLRAKSEADYSAAVAGMLATLHDPATRILGVDEPSDPSAADLRTVLTVKHPIVDVAVVSLERGTATQTDQASGSLQKNLTGAKAVVIDIRGSKAAATRIPLLPVSKVAVGPSATVRLHTGYFDVTKPLTSYYNSSWLTRQLLELQPSRNPIRPVFLVDRESLIPPIALAMQSSGEGAIVSEASVTDSQVNLSRVVTVQGNLRARVRTKDLVYADGTTGLAANVLLNKTGNDALNAAIDIARSGKWPTASGRSLLTGLPAFFHEEPYLDKPYPDTNYRLLAAARIWGVFNQFHPYKRLYGEDWDAVLVQTFPKMEAARTRREYDLAIAEMLTHTHDSHVQAGSEELFDERGGNTAPSVEIRWIENKPVVTRLYDRSLAARAAPGDVVIKINGEPVQKRIDHLSRQTTASTPQALMRHITAALPFVNGPDGTLGSITVITANGSEREFPIRHSSNARRGVFFPPAREGEVFRLITPQIGYADLERVTNDQVDGMFEMFKTTKGIILDMRGYPHQSGTNGAVASHITTRSSQQSQLPIPLIGAEPLFTRPPESLLERAASRPEGSGPQYPGKTVMLVDERAISAAETTAGWYREINGTVFIGSPTAGANGYTTRFYAPGGTIVSLSGNSWPLQRIGIIPDIEVHPTIAGIRAGRDEVLERAIAYLEQWR